MSDAETEKTPPEDTPPESEEEEAPPSVPDDWLDQKPFDPSGR